MQLDFELSVQRDLDAVEREWRRLERSADCTPFQAFEWLAAWQRHIGTREGVVPAIVLGRRNGGPLLFILPLAIVARGAVRCLTWLGADLCDYNAPILAHDFSRHIGASQFAPLWQQVIALLHGDPALRFDLVDLRKMPETVGGQPNPFRDLPLRANPSGAHIASLGGCWETFYASRRSARTRGRDRGKLRRLAAHGAIRFVDPETPEEIQRTVHVLLAQKAISLKRMGIADMFGQPGYQEFFLDVATNPALRKLVHVSRLDVGSVAVAANLGLTLRGCYYHVLLSHREGEWSRFGPGIAHLRELMRRAIERGFDRFDFTIGDEPYKREWADSELKLYDHIAALTARAWPMLVLFTALLPVKRLIKQSPMLWRAFTKARSIAGIFRSKFEPRTAVT